MSHPEMRFPETR